MDSWHFIFIFSRIPINRQKARIFVFCLPKIEENSRRVDNPKKPGYAGIIKKIFLKQTISKVELKQVDNLYCFTPHEYWLYQ